MNTRNITIPIHYMDATIKFNTTKVHFLKHLKIILMNTILQLRENRIILIFFVI